MDTVNAIKEKLDVVDLISQYVTLKKSGKNYKGNCPFHNEKTASFMVSQDIQRYRCFGCGKSGDIFNFVMDYEGVDFAEAVKILAEKTGVEVKMDKNPAYEKAKELSAKIFEMNELAARFYEFLLHKHPSGKEALEYLEGRKTKQSTIKTFRIGYAVNNWDLLSRALKQKGYNDQDIEESGLGRIRKRGDSSYDMFRQRIMFPLFDHLGRIVGFAGRAMTAEQMPKYINTSETAIFHKEKFLYGLQETKKYIKEEGSAIIVEGEFDMLSLYQNGYKNVVASKGTALTPGQVNMLKRYTETAILIFDNDKAGLEAAVRGIKIIQNIGLNIKIGVMPDDVKDPDDLMKTNPEQFKDILKDALPLWDFYFKYALMKFSLSDVFEKKRAAEFLYEVLNDIQDSVTRTNYIKKFADIFEIDRDQVEVEMAEHKNQEKSKPTSRLAKDESAAAPSIGDNLDPEIYVLSLLTHLEPTALEVYLKEVDEDYFKNEILLNIFQELKKAVDSKQFEIKAFYDMLMTSYPNTNSLFERIYLLDLGSVFADQLLLNKEISSVIKRLKKDFHSRKLKDISKAIKKAEAVQDSSQVETLLNEAEEHRLALKALSD